MSSPFVFTGPKASQRPSRVLQGQPFSSQFTGLLVGLVETVAIVAASIFGESIYQYFWLGQSGSLKVAIGIGLTASLTYVFFARFTDLYRLPACLNPWRHLGNDHRCLGCQPFSAVCGAFPAQDRCASVTRLAACLFDFGALVSLDSKISRRAGHTVAARAGSNRRRPTCRRHRRADPSSKRSAPRTCCSISGCTR